MDWLDQVTGLEHPPFSRVRLPGGSEDLYRWLVEPWIGATPAAETELGKWLGIGARGANPGTAVRSGVRALIQAAKGVVESFAAEGASEVGVPDALIAVAGLVPAAKAPGGGKAPHGGAPPALPPLHEGAAIDAPRSPEAVVDRAASAVDEPISPAVSAVDPAEVNELLQAADMPSVGTTVTLDRNGDVTSGVIEGAYTRPVVEPGVDETVVRIREADGNVVEVRADALAEAGARITPEAAGGASEPAMRQRYHLRWHPRRRWTRPQEQPARRTLSQVASDRLRCSYHPPQLSGRRHRRSSDPTARSAVQRIARDCKRTTTIRMRTSKKCSSCWTQEFD